MKSFVQRRLGRANCFCSLRYIGLILDHSFSNPSFATRRLLLLGAEHRANPISTTSHLEGTDSASKRARSRLTLRLSSRANLPDIWHHEPKEGHIRLDNVTVLRGAIIQEVVVSSSNAAYLSLSLCFCLCLWVLSLRNLLGEYGGGGEDSPADTTGPNNTTVEGEQLGKR